MLLKVVFEVVESSVVGSGLVPLNILYSVTATSGCASQLSSAVVPLRLACKPVGFVRLSSVKFEGAVVDCPKEETPIAVLFSAPAGTSNVNSVPEALTKSTEAETAPTVTALFSADNAKPVPVSVMVSPIAASAWSTVVIDRLLKTDMMFDLSDTPAEFEAVSW